MTGRGRDPSPRFASLRELLNENYSLLESFVQETHGSDQAHGWSLSNKRVLRKYQTTESPFNLPVLPPDESALLEIYTSGSTIGDSASWIEPAYRVVLTFGERLQVHEELDIVGAVLVPAGLELVCYLVAFRLRPEAWLRWWNGDLGDLAELTERINNPGEVFAIRLRSARSLADMIRAYEKAFPPLEFEALIFSAPGDLDRRGSGGTRGYPSGQAPA